MKKREKCEIKKEWEYISVEYNEKAPLEERVNTLATCVEMLAKSVLTLSGKFDKEVNAQADINETLVEAVSNLIDDVLDIQEELWESKEESEWEFVKEFPVCPCCWRIN